MRTQDVTLFNEVLVLPNTLWKSIFIILLFFLLKKNRCKRSQKKYKFKIQ